MLRECLGEKPNLLPNETPFVLLKMGIGKLCLKVMYRSSVCLVIVFFFRFVFLKDCMILLLISV